MVSRKVRAQGSRNTNSRYEKPEVSEVQIQALGSISGEFKKCEFRFES